MRQLATGVHKFQTQAFAKRRELFERLADGQKPHSLFITCADSRIDPTLLTQSEPGELFILRNAGNLVPVYTDDSGAEAAAIEYALEALGVEHIVICGHSHCGAMTALVKPEMTNKLPAVRTWLQNAAATHKVVMDNYSDRSEGDLINLTIQENVLVQIENLRTHPSVAARLSTGKLTLHAWVYKLETGDVFAFDPAVGQFKQLADVDTGERRATRAALDVAL